MKIDVSEMRYGLIISGYSLIKKDLYHHLHMEVYGAPPFMTWQALQPGSTLRTLKWTEVNLNHMARELRKLGWAAYHWRDRHGISDAQSDSNSWINYGKREGLVLGRHCANLTAWLLSHT